MLGPTYIVAIEGLDEATAGLEAVSTAIRRNLSRAVNKTTRDGRVMASRRIRDQVALPASYLAPSTGRLVVSKKASQRDLEGIIRGRAEPTSLARFTKQQPRAPGQRNQKQGHKMRVMVKPGVAKYIREGFVLRLNNNNLGVAVRSDTQPKGAYKPKKIGDNLYLLYGPSISSILYSARNEDRKGGVAGQISPELEAKLLAEFERLQNAGL